ncbi:MAG TPA: hypothetical protein VD833_14325 [Vicinamibacterales bacterium]|nr:hypothetical protein [Vicinamibacterales bacterium]
MLELLDPIGDASDCAQVDEIVVGQPDVEMLLHASQDLQALQAVDAEPLDEVFVAPDQRGILPGDFADERPNLCFDVW